MVDAARHGNGKRAGHDTGTRVQTLTPRQAFDPASDADCAYLATALVAYTLGLNTEEVFSPRNRKTADTKARHVAIYLTYVALGTSFGRVAKAFGRDRSSVAYACKIVENRREDADFDDWCEQLEVGLKSVIGLRAIPTEHKARDVRAA